MLYKQQNYKFRFKLKLFSYRSTLYTGPMVTILSKYFSWFTHKIVKLTFISGLILESCDSSKIIELRFLKSFDSPIASITIGMLLIVKFFNFVDSMLWLQNEELRFLCADILCWTKYFNPQTTCPTHET